MDVSLTFALTEVLLWQKAASMEITSNALSMVLSITFLANVTTSHQKVVPHRWILAALI